MKLANYLQQTGETPNAFAQRAGFPAHTIYRYLNGRVPRPDLMRSIFKATKGEVQPNDFYDLPKIHARKKAA